MDGLGPAKLTLTPPPPLKLSLCAGPALPPPSDAVAAAVPKEVPDSDDVVDDDDDDDDDDDEPAARGGGMSLPDSARLLREGAPLPPSASAASRFAQLSIVASRNLRPR